MSTKDMIVQVRYTCPACKGTGYIKSRGFIRGKDETWDSSPRLFDKVCCDICDNGYIQEWVNLSEVIAKVVGDEFVKRSRKGKLR